MCNKNIVAEVMLLLVLQRDLCKWKIDKSLLKVGDLYIIHVPLVSELNTCGSWLSEWIPHS